MDLQEYFMVDGEGRVVNAVTTARARAEVQAQLPNLTLKTHDELTPAQLSGYRFYAERP